MSAADIWVAKDDGSDLVRAASIVGVGRDYDGNITVRLSGCEHAVVKLVAGSGHHGPHTPDEFHRQLLQVITQLIAYRRGRHRAPGARRLPRLDLAGRAALGAACQICRNMKLEKKFQKLW